MLTGLLQQFPDRCKTSVQLLAHADILRTLSREDQRNLFGCVGSLQVNPLPGQRPQFFVCQRDMGLLQIVVLQNFLRGLPGFGDDRQPTIGLRQFAVQQLHAFEFDPNRRICRNIFPLQGFVRCLLQLHDKIGTAETKRINLQTTWLTVLQLPFLRSVQHGKAGLGPVDCGIGLFTVERGGEYSRIHCHHAADQAVDARRAQGVAHLRFETGQHRAFVRRINRLQRAYLFHIALTGRRCMALHQVDRLGSIRQAGKGGFDRPDLALTGRLDHAGFGIAGADAGHIAVDTGAPLFCDRFALQYQHAGAFPHDESVPVPVKRPGHRRRRPLMPTQASQRSQYRKLQEMHCRQRFFGAAHYRGIQYAILDQLHCAVQCHQRGGAGSQHRIAGAGKTELVADKPRHHAAETAEQRGVVLNASTGGDFLSHRRRLVRVDFDYPGHGSQNFGNRVANRQVAADRRHLRCVLRQNHADPLTVDRRLQNSRICHSLSRRPEGQFRRVRHVFEILRRHIDVTPIHRNVGKGCHPAIGLARQHRLGVKISLMIPFFLRHCHDSAAQFTTGLPNFRRTVPQRIDQAHAGNCDPFRRCFLLWRRRRAGHRLMQLIQTYRLIQDACTSAAHKLSFRDSNRRLHGLTGPGIKLPGSQQQTAGCQFFQLMS